MYLVLFLNILIKPIHPPKNVFAFNSALQYPIAYSLWYIKINMGCFLFCLPQQSNKENGEHFSSDMCSQNSLREPVVFSEILFDIYTQCSSPLWVEKEKNPLFENMEYIQII